MNEPSVYNALLVYPRFPPSYWGFQYAIELMGKSSAMPPLGLLTVAAMFPAHYRLRLVDTNVAALADQALRRLRRLYRRLRPEFRASLSPDLAKVEQAIRACVREAPALARLQRIRPHIAPSRSSEPSATAKP